MKQRHIFAAVFLVAGCAAPDTEYVINQSDRGGYVYQYIERVNAMVASGESMEIRAASCISACTFYLGVPGTCVSPTTRFGFHGAGVDGVRLHPDPRHDFVIAAVYRRNSPALADWFIANAAWKMPLKYLMGKDLVEKFGFPQCK